MSFLIIQFNVSLTPFAIHSQGLGHACLLGQIKTCSVKRVIPLNTYPINVGLSTLEKKLFFHENHPFANLLHGVTQKEIVAERLR